MKTGVWKFLDELANKKGITEIIINDIDRVFVEREGVLIQLNVSFSLDDIEQFVSDVAELNQKECDHNHPILDGNLADGSRINIITYPFVKKCPAITIRKYLKFIRSFDNNPGIFGIDEQWSKFFKALVKAKMNLIVSGGTGAGKTTFLNLLLQEISSKERIVTIEDTLELQFNHSNLVRLEAREASLASNIGLSINDLVKNSLRMRPDRIILGEVRGGEFFDLLQAMNTGHNGSMTSIHANSAIECLERMEGLFLLSGFNLPYQVVRKFIASAIDFIIQIRRDRDGKRVVAEVTEIVGMEGDTILTNSVALYSDGALHASGFVPQRINQLKEVVELSDELFF